MGSRAHLLAGLRTGGPRASSPFEGDNSTHSIIDHQRHHSGSPTSNGASLKANAAPFTPGGRRASRGSPTRDSTQELEGQFAALRMQHAMAAAVANHAQPHLAAMYGATSGQPLASETQYGQTYDYQTQLQAQEMEQLIRQKQAQLVQNQLLQQQQHQQNRQSQIDALRVQAANHQKQQQMLAQQQQQQLLLAQMQADMEAQQQQVYTAQEQRQPAQASIQAGLRQRQVQQMYAQLLQQQQHQQQHPQQDEAVSQQEALLQRLHYLRQLQQGAASSPPQQQQFVDFVYNSSPPQTGGRVPARSGSPAQAQLERRQRQASNTAADSAVSWRSTSVSLTKSASAQTRSPPSIVVDDGASEKSEPGTASSTTSEPLDTPETSSEDVGTMMRSKSAVPTRTVKKMPVLAPLAVPRAISLSTAPRARTFSSSVDGVSKSGNNSGTGSPSGAMAGASRQPRGPPTEFHTVNFTSRINARTRRDAMSKLCASPRAASFNLTATRASVLT